jgi:type III secretion system chaperone SycN
MQNWITDTVRVFGEDLGIDELALDPEQGLEFELDSGECIGIRHLPDIPGYDLLIYWGRRLQFDPASQLERSLRLVNGRQALPWPAQAAIRDDMLILTLRMPARSFDLPALEQALRQLEAMQDQAAG